MKAQTHLPLACLLAALPAAVASAQYATSFEAPAFLSGTIHGQDSWTSTTPDRAQVLTADEIATALTTVGLTPGTTVHSGSQALLVSGAGNSSATIRVIPGLSAANVVVLDVWTRPLTPGTSTAPIGNVFLTMEDGSGNRAAAFRFGYVDGVQRIDYGTAITGIWQASGTLWDSDTWYRMTLSVDYAAKNYNFDIDGVRVNSAPIPFYTSASANFHQIRIFRGSNQAGMIVDDLTVVPEPTVLALLALGGLAARWRRKCRRWSAPASGLRPGRAPQACERQGEAVNRRE